MTGTVRSDISARPTRVGAWSRGKLQAVDVCPACHSDARKNEVYKRRDDKMAMADIWQMVICADCDSLYLDPRPDDTSLPRAYDEYFTHSKDVEDVNSDGMSGFLWKLVNGYLNRRFGMHRRPANSLGHLTFRLALPWGMKLDYYCRNLAAKNFPDRGTLLDLGCGNGSFLGRALEMGWDAIGCEPDADAAHLCYSMGLDVIHGDVFDIALDRRQFDVITLSHVIEHMPDMHAGFVRLHTLLKPGGTIWFALPNPNSIVMKQFGSASVNLHFPCHLCIPSQRQFVRMLENAGFMKPKIVRRGIQAASHWTDSMRIAEEQQLDRPGTLKRKAGHILSDMLATITMTWAEESVYVTTRR